MSTIRPSIRHNLAGLARFSGRDTRRQFWPYAIFVFLLSIIAGMVVTGIVLGDMMAKLARYVTDHPGGLPPPVPGKPPLPPELVPDVAWTMVPMGVIDIVVVLLLAAAVARRLHDRDRTGLWGLAPVPFMFIGLATTEAAWAQAITQRPPTQMESAMFMATPLFWIALVGLIILLASEGTNGPNRFGPDPAAQP